MLEMSAQLNGGADMSIAITTMIRAKISKNIASCKSQKPFLFTISRKGVVPFPLSEELIKTPSLIEESTVFYGPQSGWRRQQ